MKRAESKSFHFSFRLEEKEKKTSLNVDPIANSKFGGLFINEQQFKSKQLVENEAAIKTAFRAGRAAAVAEEI